MTSKHGNKGVPLSIPKVIEWGEPQNQITQRALSVPARDTTKFPFLRKGLASPHRTHAHTPIHIQYNGGPDRVVFSFPRYTFNSSTKGKHSFVALSCPFTPPHTGCCLSWSNSNCLFQHILCRLVSFQLPWSPGPSSSSFGTFLKNA